MTVFELFDIYKVISVCDGHGTDFFSKHITKVLRFYLHEMLNSRPTDIEQVLVTLVQLLHENVEIEAKNKNITNGGTTFTICIIDQSRSLAFFANLGDSPGFVLSRNVLEDGIKYSIKFRTTDHDASSVSEQERAHKSNPRVRFINGYAVIPYEFEDIKIMPLRGFGDYLFGSIIEREPSVSTVPLEDGDIIIVSSDGLVEMFDGTRLCHGRDEGEICDDVLEAIQTNQDIGSFLVQNKILRNVKAYMDLYRIQKSEQKIFETYRMIENAMDNHMLGIYTFSITPAIERINLPILRRCVSA